MTAVAVGVWSSQASAHVTIDTLGPVSQGSFAKIGFSVPNERDDAGTVVLSVQLPQDEPLAFVSVQPMPGWEISTTTRTLEEPLEGEGQSITEVVDTVTWTATGDTQIAPGQFELFWISAGPMPTDVTELAFPAVQTYSSGEEVAWIEETTEGAAEPERPAPTLQLVPAEGGEGAAVRADSRRRRRHRHAVNRGACDWGTRLGGRCDGARPHSPATQHQYGLIGSGTRLPIRMPSDSASTTSDLRTHPRSDETARRRRCGGCDGGRHRHRLVRRWTPEHRTSHRDVRARSAPEARADGALGRRRTAKPTPISESAVAPNPARLQGSARVSDALRPAGRSGCDVAVGAMGGRRVSWSSCAGGCHSLRAVSGPVVRARRGLVVAMMAREAATPAAIRR